MIGPETRPTYQNHEPNLALEGKVAHHSSLITHQATDGAIHPALDPQRSALVELADVEFRWQEPLSRHTTFRVGGPVSCLARPRNEKALGSLMRVIRDQMIPCLVLGGGSNVLAPDGPWEMLALQLTLACSNIVRCEEVSGDRVLVHVGAGVRLARLLRFCLSNGLGGLEFLVGIPGTIGGAVVMNAGTKEGEVADVLRWVDIMDQQGEKRRLDRTELKASYRCMGLPENAMVLGVCLQLSFSSNELLRRRFYEIMERRRLNQPLGWPSAGCVFKNPPGMSAGLLIEKSGLKGHRVGGAEVSQKHANWIINRGDAKARDIIALICHIEECIAANFGVRLEREICVLAS